MNAELGIGTSGWHYKHWRNLFYPAKLPSSAMLGWYVGKYDTVEINNTFYRLPAEDALLGWQKTAPPNFLFSVKASRFITHIKRLRESNQAISLFFSRVELLGDNLGPILFQLPPGWTANLDRLAEFLPLLPRTHRYAVEFRDQSWYTPATQKLLRSHNIALCIHDWRGLRWPMEITADFMYIRLHGPGGRYQGHYDKRTLHQWANRIQQWPALCRGSLFILITTRAVMRWLIRRHCGLCSRLAWLRKRRRHNDPTM
jgi:uncharacterized protein YecE (DUF72 family)